MKFESIKSDKFQAFEQSQIKQLNAIIGGANRLSLGIGGDHKGMMDSIQDDGSVTWDNGDRGHIKS